MPVSAVADALREARADERVGGSPVDVRSRPNPGNESEPAD
jgi:hypothetical protein